jgi:hypothetical protein
MSVFAPVVSRPPETATEAVADVAFEPLEDSVAVASVLPLLPTMVTVPVGATNDAPELLVTVTVSVVVCVAVMVVGLAASAVVVPVVLLPLPFGLTLFPQPMARSESGESSSAICSALRIRRGWATEQFIGFITGFRDCISACPAI